MSEFGGGIGNGIQNAGSGGSDRRMITGEADVLGMPLMVVARAQSASPRREEAYRRAGTFSSGHAPRPRYVRRVGCCRMRFAAFVQEIGDLHFSATEPARATDPPHGPAAAREPVQAARVRHPGVYPAQPVPAGALRSSCPQAIRVLRRIL